MRDVGLSKRSDRPEIGKCGNESCGCDGSDSIIDTCIPRSVTVRYSSSRLKLVRRDK